MILASRLTFSYFRGYRFRSLPLAKIGTAQNRAGVHLQFSNSDAALKPLISMNDKYNPK